MKYIHVLIQRKTEDCQYLQATMLVFDSCHNLELSEDIELPIHYNKEDVRSIYNPSILDYSVTVDYVGGRPNDRK